MIEDYIVLMLRLSRMAAGWIHPSEGSTLNYASARTSMHYLNQAVREMERRINS